MNTTRIRNVPDLAIHRWIRGEPLAITEAELLRAADGKPVRIIAHGWAHGRTGAARPAFGRGRYHVQLDGDRTDYMFDARELEALERGADLR